MPAGRTRFGPLRLPHELKRLDLTQALIDAPADGRRQDFGSLNDPIGIDQELAADIDARGLIVDAINLSEVSRTICDHREWDAPVDHFCELFFVPDLVNELAVDTDRDHLNTKLLKLIKPVSDR